MKDDSEPASGAESYKESSPDLETQSRNFRVAMDQRFLCLPFPPFFEQEGLYQLHLGYYCILGVWGADSMPL